MEPTQPTPSPGPETGLPFPDNHARERELDALRIQAAAVAAQQAALTEEEARFEQRRVALDQQEKQLAAHLEEKRRQLLHLQDEVRKARVDLLEQKKTYEKRVGEAADDLARERNALADSQRLAKKERSRLIGFRRDLKQRWHRHWFAERQKMRRAEQELASRRRAVEKDAERLRAEREALAQDRLRFNGVSELGARQLQAGWADLRGEEKRVHERLAKLNAEASERARLADRRDADLTRAARELDDQKRQWQCALLHLQKEADGLESRARNHRRKVLDLEQEAQRLEAIVQSRNETIKSGEQCAVSAPLQLESASLCSSSEIASPESAPAAVFVTGERILETDSDPGQFTALERLAGDLADQRMHLVEQWQRLLHARQCWQTEHDNAVAELATLGLRLHEQEKSHAVRERALVTGEVSLRQRLTEIIQVRHSLEGCQARLRARVCAWEGERDRLLAQVQGREQAAERRLRAVGGLRAQWKKRRRLELDRLQAAIGTAGKAHAEYARLRDACLRRQAALDNKDRTLAEQSLALEQYRLECTGQSEDSPAAEKQLDRLRRRWANLSASSERAILTERAAIHAEAARSDDRFRRALEITRAFEADEAKLTEKQTAWEHEHALAADKAMQMGHEVRTLKAQCERYERQIEELRDEVDRVARILLGDQEPATIPLVQAA